jgi:hypothetical protein
LRYFFRDRHGVKLRIRLRNFGFRYAQICEKIREDKNVA